MNAPTSLEDRLRRGLQSAADALPEAPLAPPAAGGDGGSSRSSRRPGSRRFVSRRWVPLAAAVATVAVATAALVAVTRSEGDGDDQSDVQVASPGEGAQEPREVRQANGRVPGQAVIVPTTEGTSELRTYGPDGTQTGTVDLAPFEDVQAASSDLDGGWVVCGSVPQEAPADASDEASAQEAEGRAAGADPTRSTTTVPATSPDGSVTVDDRVPTGWVDQLVWFPAGRDPVVLEPSTAPLCIADSVQVVDSAEGPTLVYPSMPMSVDPALHALVLATGEDREVPLRVEGTTDARWSASTGRVVAVVDDGPLQLFDLVSGDSLPIAAIDLPRASDIVLAPDATSVALIVDPTGALEPAEVVVYDLATGAERFRETFPMSLEGAQLSYDGTTLAVGNWSDSYGGTTTVIDLASGARHTIDSHGLVL